MTLLGDITSENADTCSCVGLYDASSSGGGGGATTGHDAAWADLQQADQLAQAEQAQMGHWLLKAPRVYDRCYISRVNRIETGPREDSRSRQKGVQLEIGG